MKISILFFKNLFFLKNKYKKYNNNNNEIFNLNHYFLKLFIKILIIHIFRKCIILIKKKYSIILEYLHSLFFYKKNIYIYINIYYIYVLYI